MRFVASLAALAVIAGCPGDLTSPTVDAGEDRVVFAGDLVELTGVVTSDDPHSIEWKQISGREVELEGANTLKASFVAPSVTGPQPLVFALTAVTERGASASDYVTITVDLVNRPPRVAAGPAQTVMSADRVILSGSADDEDGTIASLLWRQTSGRPISLSNVNAETPTFVAPETDETMTLTFELTATDDDGASTTADTRVTVVPRVIAGNVAPHVDAGPDQIVDELVMVTLAGTATDADGRIVQLGWTQLSGPPVTLSSTSAERVEFLAPGVAGTTDLLFELAATDDRGARVADRTNVRVTPLLAPNQPPIADAGPDQSVLQGSSVTLAGSGTDADGQIAGYSWRQIAGPTVALDDAAIATPSFTAPQGECEIVLSFELTVTDNEGAIGVDTVTIFADPAGAPASLVRGEVLDFESTAQDRSVASGTPLWERGIPASGPLRAHSGLRVWATSLAGNYPNGAQAYLRFPMIDLRNVADPTLSFRMWLRAGEGDAVSLEIHDDETGWMTLPGSWTRAGYQNQYALIALPLGAWSGRQVCVRLAFTSDAAGTAAGAYIDDVALHDESDDPDADGVPGIRSELMLGLDPFVADSDGDGVDDGPEISDGTDPLDPAWYVGAPTLSPGNRLDFEGSRQGVATSGSLWQHGVPIDGPGRAHSGSFAWATDLDGDYFSEAVEYLYLPRLDLRFSTDPTLSFRLWMRSPGTNDGLSLEIREPGMDWEPLLPEVPAQEGIDPEGRSAWSNAGYQIDYALAAISLAPYVGNYVRVRLVFRSDASGEAAGAVIDDVQLHEEGADPDGDGLPGVLTELMSVGTDPFEIDTDRDGTYDGIELADGTDPTNPAWYGGSLLVSPGSLYEFETSANGAATTGRIWRHAVVTTGPERAHSGSWAWVAENYPPNAIEYLYLPRINLIGAMNPTLSFRIWIKTGNGDGVHLEIETPNGWAPIAPSLVGYDGLAGGLPAWRSQGYRGHYVLVAFSLATYVGSQINARLVFQSDGSGEDVGAFIDDFAVFEETDDPDRDGLPGILTEIRDYGTDPFSADTDFDGFNDGAEAAAMRDPLDPADFVMGPILQIGAYIDFEQNAGGLASLGVPPGLPVQGSLWARGVPVGGPGAAFSGTRVFATNPAGNYFDDAREVLHLPPINLVGLTDPTLSFRLWSQAGSGDGVSIEVYLPGLGWGPIVPAFPPRDGFDAVGRPAWCNQGGTDGWVLAAASLQLYTNTVARVRFVFRSNSSGTAAGAYIDDIRLNLEASDPDGDGLFGVITERGLHGTDPFLFDTDGDGIGDGAEVAAGTDPLDPNSP